MSNFYRPTLFNPRMIGKSNMRTSSAIVALTLAEGDFTSVQDAIDSLGEGASIFLKNGTYSSATISVDHVSIVGESWNAKIYVDGGSTIPLLVTGNRCIFRNMAFATAAGSGGSQTGALYITGTYNITDHCYFPEADVAGYASGGIGNTISNSLFGLNIDGTSITLATGFQKVFFNTTLGQSTSSTIDTNVNVDNSQFIGNDISGVKSVNLSINVAVGSDDCIFVGNQCESELRDSGSDGVEAGNRESY